jgi:uncharacterized protein (TIGR02246 family)
MRAAAFAVLLLAAVPGPLSAHGKPAAAPAPAPVAPRDRAAVAVVDAFHNAVAVKDLAAAAALLAEDVKVYEHGGVERSKAQYVAEHLPADAEAVQGTTDTIVSRFSATDGPLAYVITDGRTTSTRDGKTTERKTTETMILRRDPAGWRIVHIHWSSGKG